MQANKAPSKTTNQKTELAIKQKYIIVIVVFKSTFFYSLPCNPSFTYLSKKSSNKK